MQWSYLKTTLTGEDQIGPVSDSDFMAAIKAGQVKMKSKVHHPKFTSGKWTEARLVPAVASAFAKIKKDKEVAKRKTDEEWQRDIEELQREREYRLQTEAENKVVQQKELEPQQRNEEVAGAVEAASSSSSYDGAYVAMIFGLIGVLIGLVIIGKADSVLHEIFGVLVSGFSVMLMGIAAILRALAEISNKLGASFFINEMNDKKSEK